eukprot:TRINITY_DN19091_c0_g2_i3.p1 TRINITY_DN19091_c0_g2~~TRINITY_DN19091_c0_g2_i3.p1  ORF type:complete len:260 (-),score=13.89 TRINITY_DN19091_c0_g2_i3:14-793(-)
MVYVGAAVCSKLAVHMTSGLHSKMNRVGAMMVFVTYLRVDAAADPSTKKARVVSDTSFVVADSGAFVRRFGDLPDPKLEAPSTLEVESDTHLGSAHSSNRPSMSDTATYTGSKRSMTRKRRGRRALLRQESPEGREGGEERPQRTQEIARPVSPRPTTTTSTWPPGKWILGNAGASCDATCQAEDAECDVGTQNLVTSGAIISNVAKDANSTCTTTKERATTDSPFIGAGGHCHYVSAGGKSACGSPRSKNDRKLCYCF